jgi:hypothetical protein
MEMEDAMKETGLSYVLLKQLVDKVKNVAQNIREEEDPTDIIAMDVPLFLRMLEWAKEEAAEDVDLHEVTTRAIEAVKLRGLLSMEDYDSLIGESIQDIDEAKLPGLWANIRAKRERGEKPSSKGSKAYKTAVAAGKRINKEK